MLAQTRASIDIANNVSLSVKSRTIPLHSFTYF